MKHEIDVEASSKGGAETGLRHAFTRRQVPQGLWHGPAKIVGWIT
jgi:hypothetical protein